MHIMTHYVLLLKLISYYMSIISQLTKGKIKFNSNFELVFLSHINADVASWVQGYLPGVNEEDE